MNATLPTSVGWLIAVVVLILAVGLQVFDLQHFDWALSLIGALAVARLVP